MWPDKSCMDSLVYWTNPAYSAIVFGSVLVVLLAVKYVSFLSVVGNLALALLTATMAIRIYKSVLAAINKSSDGHPFRVSSFFCTLKPVFSHSMVLMCVKSRRTWTWTSHFPRTRLRSSPAT